MYINNLASNNKNIFKEDYGYTKYWDDDFGVQYRKLSKEEAEKFADPAYKASIEKARVVNTIGFGLVLVCGIYAYNKNFIDKIFSKLIKRG